MRGNESTLDRVIRVGLGIAVLAVGWSGAVTGGWGSFFKVIGFLPLLTGALGFCPAYALLGLRTKKAQAS